MHVDILVLQINSSAFCFFPLKANSKGGTEMSIILLFYWALHSWPRFRPYGKTDDNRDVDLLALDGRHIGMALFYCIESKRSRGLGISVNDQLIIRT